MRKALDKFSEIYGTQLGNDVIETLGGAVIAAGGQALFTDMTPEEIALATSFGVGSAIVGRPLGGRAGKFIGNKISERSPAADKRSQQIINFIVNSNPEALQPIVRAKFGQYADLNPTTQLAATYGRSRGDNIAQGAVALTTPFFFTGEDEEEVL
ncbi:hypothetical protein [Synechococcus sp. WH 8016]|uniref:hypothetical protein n=1 Tax=Synechococcus sp. WH 8016 TaxID=166318 RepID=UPI00022D8BD9|nr:hypothetical protein [Synechococcus sp. WH 8016]EHA63811.1 hypothetical protein Syn8016DRAFT_0853 [Synechococcus sp. WH 8016]